MSDVIEKNVIYSLGSIVQLTDYSQIKSLIG
jgi:hypothetical protein